MNGLLNPSVSAISPFQTHFPGSSHLGQMYASQQRPSFAIQELLGLNSGCRGPNPTQDYGDVQMPPSNLMFFHGLNGPIAADTSSVNYHLDHSHNNNPSLCSWRFDFGQPNQGIGNSRSTQRPQDNNSGFCFKPTHIGEEGKIYQKIII